MHRHHRLGTFTAFAFIEVDGRRQHLLVDEQPQNLHEPAWLFLRDPELILRFGIENVVGVGQLEHSNVFTNEE